MATAFKDYYDGECARILATYFDLGSADDFAAEVDAAVGPLELKDRVLVLARGMKDRLPQHYPDALDQILRHLKQELDDTDGMFNEGWQFMPVARFVEEFGLDYPDESLEAIRAITRMHTGEFAIRPYLEQHYDLAMSHVRRWSRSDNVHERRLSSEGIRPRLPWGRTLKRHVDDPQAVIDVIQHLHNDSSLYVRKSVANNLNDISKDHPELAVRTARDWNNEWVTQHGLRTLIKAGDPGALELVGMSANPHVTVDAVTLSPTVVPLDNTLTIDVALTNSGDTPAKVVVDYIMQFRGKNGAMRLKVFKLKTTTIEPQSQVTLTKRHAVKNTTTRTLYPGTQGCVVQVNGVRGDVLDWTIVP